MSIAERFLARLLCLALAMAMAVCVSAAAQAQTQTRPKRTDVGGDTPKVILWVGNSFLGLQEIVWVI